MSAKHTPGPWITSGGLERDMEITSPHRIENSIGPIAEMDCFFDGSMDPEQQANARLIAAAPDLLEALTALVGLARMRAAPLGDYVSALAVADAAIAKATGE